MRMSSDSRYDLKDGFIFAYDNDSCLIFPEEDILKKARIFGFMVTVFLLTPFLAAAEPGETGKKDKPAEEQPMLMQMLRIKDAVSGEIRKPTAAELQLLMPVNPVSRSTNGLVSRNLKGGGVELDLHGRFKNVVLAKLGPDGKLVTTCVTSEKELRQFMKNPVAKKKEVAHVR